MLDLPTRLTVHGRTVSLTCHMAVLSGRHRRNSFAAIRECVEAKAARIEVDVHSLSGGDYIVYHERRLERETDSTGSVGSIDAGVVRGAHFQDDATDRPPLLSELVEMAKASPATELQLDLKDWRPMADDRIYELRKAIDPISDRVIISTGQDWNLRRLHRCDPLMRTGFDPGHYIDHAIESTPVFLPRTMGAYGYRDDHPMAFGRTEATSDYLAERMHLLILQAPASREFFLNYRLILQMLDDGFNAVDWLHERSIEVTAWTPDYGGAESLRTLLRLIDAGVDRITTNTIPQWLDALASTGAAASDAAG